MLSDAAARRLRAYCSRARRSRSDICATPSGREVRYISADLRRVIWNDVAVRDVLIAAGEDRNAWDALVASVGRDRGLALLDLVSAMSLEARLTGVDG